jgi:RNA polymerase sigma factor (sigma-70 family)
VKKHILNNSGTTDDVSDVFQDTVIVLYKQIIENSLNLTTDLKGYFFGIARNIWSAQLRKKLKMSEIELDYLEESEQEENPDPLLERVISRAFTKLKPDMQKVLSMYSEGFSYEEIAAKLDLKNESYARRKKYISKETLLELVKEDPEYQEFLRLQK